MRDKANELEKEICSALAPLGEVHRMGDLEIDPSQTSAGIWVSVKGDEPVCDRQRLSVTYYVRTHADRDTERKLLDSLAAALTEAAERMSFACIPDAAVLQLSGGEYSMEDDFHVQTFNQIIHIREV